jgi:hypothetical protein
MFPAKLGYRAPPSAWRRMARICGSLNLLVFIEISSIIKPEKIPLLKPLNGGEGYQYRQGS